MVSIRFYLTIIMSILKAGTEAKLDQRDISHTKII